jgi:beta-glucosidase
MTGQIPVYHAHKATGRPAKDIVLIDDIPVGAGQTSLGCTSYHLDAGDSPLFPFGYGLSYTTFAYGPVGLSSPTLEAGRGIIATCDITNTGTRDAMEVVQLYVRDVVGSLARPVRELKGFDKIFLKAGETKSVRFEITPETLAFWHADNTNHAEPGEFQIWIAPDSQSGRPAVFHLK